jgi:predicted phage terminase large subunit-like protein
VGGQLSRRADALTDWRGRLAALSLPKRRALSRALAPRLTKYVPHKPTPKQAAFLLLPNREAFYGGAAGGGKSDALLMAALQYVDVSGYAALILRRTLTDLNLPEALMSRSHEWLDRTDARWDGMRKTWVFPSGATLTFGYLEAEKDKYRYQSSAFQFIGLDETTQFTETQYRYMFSRTRRLRKTNVPVRVRSASNPGNIGHDWVKQRFITEGVEKKRPYIPAKLGDNPYLDQEEYKASLDNLDPVTKRQLLDGDWSARQLGGKFRREWFKIVDERPLDLKLVRFWDLASTEPKKEGHDPDWTAGVLMGRNARGFFVCDVRRLRGTPGTVEDAVEQTTKLDGRRVAVWIEEEPGSSGKNTSATYVKKLAGYEVRGRRSTGSKEERANPLSSQAEAGNVYLVRGTWCTDFLDELEGFPKLPHDDQVDAASGAFKELTAGKEAVIDVDFEGGQKRASPWKI